MESSRSSQSHARSGCAGLLNVYRFSVRAEGSTGAFVTNSVRSALSTSAESNGRFVEVHGDFDLAIFAGDAGYVESAVRRIRENGEAAPLIAVATGLGGALSARILDGGADDCVVHPFDSYELCARARAVLRRAGVTTPTERDVDVNWQTRQVRVRSSLACLSPMQFKIFVYLLERRDRWVTCSEIITAICGTHHDEDTSLVRVHIHKLRKALGSSQSCLRSNGHKGYMFTLAGG